MNNGKILHDDQATSSILVKWFNDHLRTMLSKRSNNDNNKDDDQGFYNDDDVDFQFQLQSIVYDNELLTKYHGTGYNLIRSTIAHYNCIWLRAMLKYFLLVHDDDATEERYCLTTTDGTGQHDLRRQIIAAIHHQQCPTTLLRQLIHIIYWLDHAKITGFLQGDPNLFVNPNSSWNILRTLCLSVMLPEQWERMQYRLKRLRPLQHQELPLDHLDFQIKQLSNDLCDGLRLARFIQILFPGRFPTLLKRLKYPCQRLPIRLKNVWSVFEECGSLLSRYDRQFKWNRTNAHKIAEGYEKETIELMFSLQRIQLNIQLEHYYKPHLQNIVIIQRFIRNRCIARQCRNDFLKLKWAAILVQSRYRAKKQREQYLRTIQVIRFIQKRFRQKYRFKLIVNHVHQWLLKRQTAALLIQRQWRGYYTRIQMFTKHPELFIIWKRLQNLSPGLSIGEKSDNIIQLFISMNDHPTITINESIILLLNALNRYCDWSKTIQIHNLSQNSVPLIKTFLKMLQSLNRSEPHKLALEGILGLLDHLLLTKRCHLPEREIHSKLIDSLMRSTNNHLSNSRLVYQCLSLIQQLTMLNHHQQQQHDQTSMTLVNNTKWRRLSRTLWDRYGSQVPEGGGVCHQAIQPRSTGQCTNYQSPNTTAALIQCLIQSISKRRFL